MAVIKGKPVADSITAAIKEKTEELKMQIKFSLGINV